jgi:hypothetical protein
MTITDIMILLTIEDKDFLRNGASQMIHAFDGSWDRLIHIHPFRWMVKCIRFYGQIVQVMYQLGFLLLLKQ